MTRRRAFHDILGLIRHFLQVHPDYYTVSKIAEEIGADQRVAGRYIQVLQALGHLEEYTSDKGVKMVRWKRENQVSQP